MTKKLTKVAMTTALAAAAIVPAVVATPAQAAEAEVTFAKAYYTTANGTAAFEADKLGSVISTTKDTNVTYVEGSNGEVFDMKTFSAYFAANKTATTNEVLTALSKAGKALSADQVKALNVKKGDVVDGKVTVDPTAVVKTALEEAIAKAEASPKAAELKDAIAVAKAVAENADATQAEVDAAVKALNEAIAKAEAATELKVESVKAINKTTVEVAFNKALDQATASNFTIEGGKVNSATLSEDKMSVTLDVSGLDYDTSYNLVTADVVADGETMPTVTTAFKTPTVQSLWDLQVVPAKGGIEADGKDNTTVTFQLVNKVTGQVDTKANDIVLDLNTTYGSLAQKRATIQNGKATVVLRSEFNAKGVTAKVDAQIIEASGDYADLIGEIAGSANVQFVPSGSENVDATYLTAANTNEADRVTLTFDKNVTVADFIKTDVNGQLTGELREDNIVAITQNGTPRAVKGFISGPSKNTLIAVLDSRGDDNAVKTANVLTDNSDVDVAVTMVNSSNQPTESNTSFKFTDARVPQVTSVNVEGMNKLIVKFSEPIASADFLIDGTFESTDNYDVTYGSFKFDEVKKEFVDNRDIVTLKLKDTFEENEDATPGFFTAGKHALQVSSIKDFAALSDTNNIGSTQNLGFTVNENKDIAQTTVKVDSPNQYRLTFDKDATITTPATNIELQVYDTETKEWVKAENGKAGLKAKPAYTVTKIPGDGAVSQYRVDVTSKWTEVYETATTKDNYYNDQFRLVVKEGALKTAVNGKTNTAAIPLDLNFAGSPMNSADVQSPVISKVETTATPGTYKVTMSEPVTEELVGAVEFLGKDKDGKTRTFAGTEGSYTLDGLQKSFTVTATDFAGMKDIVQKGGSENWTLVLKDVTDDIGNKAATVTKDFLIKKDEAAVTPFEVAKNIDKTYKVTGNAGEAADTITITFTDSVALTGTEAAIDTANFTLNGDKLPVGSSIALAADEDAIEKNTIQISVKPGTLLSSNVITLGKNLQSADGKSLTGEYSFTFKTVTLPEQEAAADQEAATPVTEAITALPAADAVTVDNATAIQEARAAYNALTPAQQALVTNVDKLEAVEVALQAAQELQAAQTELQGSIESVDFTIADTTNNQIAVGDTVTIGSVVYTVSADGTDVASDAKWVTIAHAETLQAAVEAAKTAKEGTVTSEVETAKTTLDSAITQFTETDAQDGTLQ